MKQFSSNFRLNWPTLVVGVFFVLSMALVSVVAVHTSTDIRSKAAYTPSKKTQIRKSSSLGTAKPTPTPTKKPTPTPTTKPTPTPVGK